MKFYVKNLYNLSLGYVQHDKVRWKENNCYYEVRPCPIRIGLQKIKTFYIVRDENGYHEFFSGLPVDVFSGPFDAFSPKRKIVFPGLDLLYDEISAAEFERKTNKVSPDIQKKIISQLFSIYEKACNETDLYEQKKLREKTQCQQKAESEKAAIDRLSRKFRNE